MSRAKKLHKRKRRRQMKASLRHGSKAKPKHKAKTGRTGQIQAKKNHSPKHFPYIIQLRINIPKSFWGLTK